MPIKAAMDRIYQVKVNEKHHGEHLEDIRDGLHQMCKHALQETRGD